MKNVDKNDVFDSIFKILRHSVVRGIVFSIYNQYGPQNIYSFPPPTIQKVDGFGASQQERIKEKIEKYQKFMNSDKVSKDHKNFGKEPYSEKAIQNFAQRDYLQIALKSVSLLVGEKIFEKDQSLLRMSFFGILPYPDLDICTQTYFRFYSEDGSDEPKACTFSMLVDNNKRIFIYDNINFLKSVIKDTVDKLIAFLKDKRWTVDGTDENTKKQIDLVIYDFFKELRLAEVRPFTPITSKKQIKITFAGLKNSGRTSFFLTLNRKYSELLHRNPPRANEFKIANILGTTVVNWDLNINEFSKKKFDSSAEIYLYDANLVYYFIDGTDSENVKKNSKIFELILEHLGKIRSDIPVIIVITKIDKDITKKPKIRKNIADIRSLFSNIALKYRKNFQFFESSIFDITSILRSFSGGISFLSPNKEIIDFKLREYSEILNADTLLLFNENGLVISYYNKDFDYDLKHDQELKNVFETLGPQYIEIFKNLEYDTQQSESESNVRNNADFQIDNNSNIHSFLTDSIDKFLFKTKLNNSHTVLLKKINIPNSKIYLLLYILESITENKEFQTQLENLSNDFKEILEI